MEKTKATTLLQFFVLLMICCCSSVCTAINNGSVTIAGPLTDSDVIVSSDQSFKLGFFSPPNTTNRYVGIMFNLPVLTVIWVANRDNPLNDSAGSFTISGDGNLVVLNGQKQVLWSSSVLNSSSANRTAQFLDTGNLVLQENGRTVWESFQYPTDSFVNRMRISAASATDGKRRLSSWRSPSDPSTGDFSSGVEISLISQMLIWNGSKIIFRTGPWNGNTFIGIPIMNSVYNNGFQFVKDNTESAYFTLSYSNDLGLLYFQLTSEGILIEKLWDEVKRDWQVSSTTNIPCLVYGKCGPFGSGSCNPQGYKMCTCLKGFEPRDKVEWEKGNWTGGCTRKKMLQCDDQRNTTTTSQDGFLRLTKMKVPDFPVWKSIEEESCDTMCSNNCSCIAYAYYKGLGCIHWGGNLIDITQFPQGGADLYIRVDRSELGGKHFFLRH